MTHMKQLIGVIALSLAGGLSACGGEHASDVKVRAPIAVTVVPATYTLPSGANSVRVKVTASVLPGLRR